MNNFRNYTKFEKEFNDSINILTGDNGAGKTAILEAIYIMSISKSFRTNSFRDIINKNEDYLQIFGKFVNQKSCKINVNYTKNEGKKIFYNGHNLEKNTDLIGKIPVIILSPSDQRITEGPNSLRKNFINQILCQVDDKYLKNLLNFNKLLKRRNSLLKEYSKKNKKYDLYFETIDEQIGKYSQYLAEKRDNFIKEFNQRLKQNFNKITHLDANIKIEHKSKLEFKKENFIAQFIKLLKSKFQSDLDKGYTGSGIHRDKINIYLNDNNIREIGSQGEHKVSLIALKISEGDFIKEKLDSRLIYLLDDLFSLLDKEHCIKIIKELSDENQVFITTTDLNNIDQSSLKNKSYTTFNIEKGLS
ncbi:MAG: DNA replication and repair protein RecF [Candidatus Marinimicrobia bacterium]|nr:DNA replication and repair protein RecF [Candidatus Neomarinimicrobiota bacterium]